MSPSRARLVSLAFTAIAFLLISTSSWNDSPCFDEPEHITAGFTYSDFGLLFLNPAHPPLVKEIAGRAVALFTEQPDLEGWWTVNSGTCIQEMFSGQHVHPQTLTRVARAPIIILSSCFVGIFFLILRQSQGERVALMATLMLVASPTFLAHASLVHTDVGAAAMSFLSLWFLSRYLEHPPDIRRAFFFALIAGTAVLVKFSCLLLCPVYLVAVSAVRDRKSRWKHVPLVAIVVLSLIHVAYLVHPSSSEFHRGYLNYHFSDTSRGLVGLIYETADAPRLAPWGWYATGVLVQGRRVKIGNSLPGYLNGRVYYGGDPFYFPTILLTKLPLGLWMLAGLSLLGLRKGLSSELRLYTGFACAYLLVAAASGLNLGIRHLLPAFPCCMVLIAVGLERGALEGGKALRRAVGVGFIALFCATALSFPNYLRHFNLLALGGTPVVDSNYDWGTDLFRLSLEAEREQWSPLYVNYFGGISPKSYLGERYRHFELKNPPTEGWMAVSKSLYLPLVEGDDSELSPTERAERGRLRNWLTGLQEVRSVGTFVVFKIGTTTAK